MVARWALPPADAAASEEESTSSSDSSDSSSDDEAAPAAPAAARALPSPDAAGPSAAGPSAAAAAAAAAASTSAAARPAGRIAKIKLKHGPDVCHVCGQAGHFSGFVGARYLDCVNKPCYLCGAAGHTTQACPHRAAPEAGCSAAPEARAGAASLLLGLRAREAGLASAAAAARPRAPPPRPGAWAVDAAVLKLHARRVTCLEFHPLRDGLVLSGDKSGQIAIWDINKVFERTVFPDVNRWQTNAIRFVPGAGPAAAATASYDGTIKLFDAELGVATRTLADANPGVTWAGVEEEDRAGRWTTFIGMDAAASGPPVVVAGDSKGGVLWLDARAAVPAGRAEAHKRGTKVQSISLHPLDPWVVMSAGNDYQVRILDTRKLGAAAAAAAADVKGKGRAGGADGGCVAEVCRLTGHGRVVNAAAFSPLTGRRVLTTCQDNRLRVWDAWAASPDGAPDREIVHSHSFNRHLTAFKAEWDPADAAERLFVVGRYISEEVAGAALHPVDMIDAATGATVGTLADPNQPLISPVNKPHPRRPLIVSGASRSLYAWRPAANAAKGGAAAEAAALDARPGGGGGSRDYVFFDADPGASAKKRGKAAGGVGAAKRAKDAAGDSD